MQLQRAESYKSPRVGWVDALRALAILLMVVFHFCYDLRYFGYVDWRVPNGPGWWQFRYLILALFLGTVGISLSLSHRPKVRWSKFWWRALWIGLSAFAITLMSLVMFPQGWIYFGILHFIFFASLVGISLVSYPRLALLLGALILGVHGLDFLPSAWPFNFLSPYLPDYTEDLVTPLPWLSVVLVGVWLGSLVKIGKISYLGPNLPGWVGFAARHSLAIYLLHQPVLFGLFFAAAKYA